MMLMLMLPQNDGCWRQSNSTVSTWDHVPTTPMSIMRGPYNLRMDGRKSCEGPRGPHLFRASTSSSLDIAELERAQCLQLSPINHDFAMSPDSYYRPQNIDFHLQSSTDTPTTAITETAYTIPPLGWGWQSEDARSWSAQQVSIWMQESRMETGIIEVFANNDISGAILMDLEFADLKELGIQSFGKRHQIWNHICTLRNNNGHISPKHAHFEEHEENNRHSSHSKKSNNSCETPPATCPPVPRRRRRQRQNGYEPITPADSVSIVAIEQLMPKPHSCPKGTNCPKWRKQQKLRRRIHDEHGLPISPDNGGQIFMAGNPGNAIMAPGLVNKVHYRPHPLTNEMIRPTSEAVNSVVGPSVVASSDLLGPGEPDFVLDPEALKHVEERDPQDNVMRFLALQNVEPPMYLPREFDPSIPEDPNAYPQLKPPETTVGPKPKPHLHLQALPRLQIPQTAGGAQVLPFHQQQHHHQQWQHNQHHHEGAAAAASLAGGGTMMAGGRDDFFLSPSRTTTSTPLHLQQLGASVYRFGTPASEMDVPVTQPPLDPLSRDASQSVPPNMQYRDPVERSGSRMGEWRRRSFQLSALVEETTTTTTPSMHMAAGAAVSIHARDDSTSGTGSSPTLTLTTAGAASSTGPGSLRTASSKTSLDVYDHRYENAVTHSGWMKKRKTKMLRHEWNEHHFRLNSQAQLTMHKNDMPASSAMESLNIDEYAVACSSIANNKLSAKLKALNLMQSSSSSSNNNSGPGGGGKDSADGAKDAAFSFQLVPAKPDGEQTGKLKKMVEGKKTHHFAVKTRDQRIDWMRELMLAKALRQKEGSGHEVEVNRGEKSSFEDY
jgi:hypothetical protein